MTTTVIKQTSMVLEAVSLASLPALKQPMADGLYGGVITLPGGRNVAVVYIDKAKPPKRASADKQRAWARSIGAQLITRAIGALIVSTLGDLLPQTWVWTEDDYAPNPSACAWYCYLRDGSVDNNYRRVISGAVAVRLIPLIT